MVTDANPLSAYSGIGNNNITVCPKTKCFFVSKLFLSNARSMVNKIDETCGSVTGNSADIAVITESWLTSLVTDQFINIPGYATDPTINVVVDYVPSLARVLTSSNFVI